MTSKVNWGIIGLGDIASAFANSFKNIKNARLISIASQSPEKLKKYALQFNIEKKFCFENYKNLIESKEIDIVYIALPNKFHFEWTLAALKQNKRVLCEKPLTINSKELETLNKYLENKDLYLREAFMYLYHPAYKEIFKIIRSNYIGKILEVKSFFGNKIIKKKNFFGFGDYKIDKTKRNFNKELGGGVILDLGCYPVSMSVFINKAINDEYKKKIIYNFDEKRVRFLQNIDVDAYAKVNFFDSFTSEIGCSFLKNLPMLTIIKGEKGIISIDDPWFVRSNKIYLNNNLIRFKKKFESIYSYEISDISNCILGNKKKEFIVFDNLDSFESIKILEAWNNDNK